MHAYDLGLGFTNLILLCGWYGFPVSIVVQMDTNSPNAMTLSSLTTIVIDQTYTEEHEKKSFANLTSNQTQCKDQLDKIT